MKPSTLSSQQGVVIIEAMIAILIFSVGVLGIVGMQASMIKNTSESQYRSEASYLAQQQIGVLWTSPDSLPADGSVTNIDVSSQLPQGAMTVTRSGDQYTVTITWRQAGQETTHQYRTVAVIAGA